MVVRSKACVGHHANCCPWSLAERYGKDVEKVPKMLLYCSNFVFRGVGMDSADKGEMTQDFLIEELNPDHSDNGKDEHVLAGRLSESIGEQASGRAGVPGKDRQQQAAAALKQTKESRVAHEFPRKAACFFVKHFLDRLLSTRWRRWPPLQRSSCASLSGLGSTREPPIWSKKAKLSNITQHLASVASPKMLSFTCVPTFTGVVSGGDGAGRPPRPQFLGAADMPSLWHGRVLANQATLFSMRCTAECVRWRSRETSEGKQLPWSAEHNWAAHQPKYARPTWPEKRPLPATHGPFPSKAEGRCGQRSLC